MSTDRCIGGGGGGTSLPQLHSFQENVFIRSSSSKKQEHKSEGTGFSVRDRPFDCLGGGGGGV